MEQALLRESLKMESEGLGEKEASVCLSSDKCC